MDTVVFAVVIFEEKSQSEFFEVFFDSSLTIRAAAGKLEASGGAEVVSVTSTKEVLILDSIEIWDWLLNLIIHCI